MQRLKISLNVAHLVQLSLSLWFSLKPLSSSHSHTQSLSFLIENITLTRTHTHSHTLTHMPSVPTKKSISKTTCVPKTSECLRSRRAEDAGRRNGPISGVLGRAPTNQNRARAPTTTNAREVSFLRARIIKKASSAFNSLFCLEEKRGTKSFFSFVFFS